MKEKQMRNYRYGEIIREHQGKDYLLKVAIIKEEQCSNCGKWGKVTCRLNISDNKCINYMRRSK